MMNYKILRITSFTALPDDQAYCIHHPDGSKEYFFKKKLHREDGPAVIFSKHGQNEKVYYYHGKYYGSSLSNYNDEKFQKDLAKK